MGYESSACAARRLRLFADATRDTALRAELLALLETPIDPTAITDGTPACTPSVPLASRTTAMHTPALASAPSSGPTLNERVVSEASSSVGERLADVPLSSRLPVEHLERAIAGGELVRELMACIATQARAIALVREAHAIGAISMPTEVAATLAAAAATLPAVLRGGSLPVA